ncbi:MAG: hypothetical protein M3294_01990 [Pseudomonadota bacterium]|nr:hypothetical protein [Pseudomonadota bacterium]
MLINRLQDSVLGKCTMTPCQVHAARLVLDETLPDLKPVKVKYEAARSYVDIIPAAITIRTVKPDNQA